LLVAGSYLDPWCRSLFSSFATLSSSSLVLLGAGFTGDLDLDLLLEAASRLCDLLLDLDRLLEYDRDIFSFLEDFLDGFVAVLLLFLILLSLEFDDSQLQSFCKFDLRL